jgi:hypothetical protein
MVTRRRDLCGLYLGEPDVLWDTALNPSMNPTGYWEHQEIRALRDRLYVDKERLVPLGNISS